MNAPVPSETLLANAVARHRIGNLAEAEPLYRTLLERQPGHPDVLHLLGVLRSQAGDPAEGVSLITEAIARRGNVAAYHSNLALALKALGRFDDAETALRSAIALAPGAGALVALGGVRRAAGRAADALAVYWAAQIIDPADGAAQEGIAHATAELDAAGCATGKPKPSEATLAAYRRAFRLRPAAPFAAQNLALTLQKAGESAVAIPTFHVAAALDPSEPAVLCGLGLALLSARQADRATTLLARVVRLRPGDAQDRFHLAEAAQAAGDAGRAATAYKDSAALQPASYTAWENAALIDARGDNGSALVTHARGLMAAARAEHLFWKAPVYIAMHVANDRIGAGLPDAAKRALDGFRQAAAIENRELLPWIDFLRGSLLLRVPGQEAAGRAVLKAQVPALPFLRHVTFDDEFDTLCRSVSSEELADFRAGFQSEPAAEGVGPLLFAACDDRYLRLFAAPLLLTVDAFCGEGQRMHIHIADPGPDIAEVVAGLRALLRRGRLTVSTERTPPDLDPASRRTLYTCLRLMRAPDVLDLHGHPPLVMIDIDALLPIDPRRLVDAMAPDEEAMLIHRPDSLDHLYNTISNGLIVLRPSCSTREVLERTATVLLHWLRQRNMAYFLDQIALIQGFSDVERRHGAVGILPIEELSRRLGVSDVFLPFFDEKHRAGFADRLSALTTRIHEETLTDSRPEEERRAALTALVRRLQAAPAAAT
ncbi:tetratricopeptide repeat protein [Azospirillum formosense]|uniref:Tetratricopeptide repeat protein n=1 Tax=Azospirillum formosense TaxID=861533 RepID=A0ABX2KNY0_9PROT|nr:tetratricopeptide repeat protein [Azospirillum formosense]MBY3756172.1 tetratricopeptide repeat protein [Azospirillum formosense]NUB17845.1 tetratricopeptide repeat protein [Azospirillum formosense]